MVFGLGKSSQKSEMAVGLDIGNYAVKVAQITKKEDNYQLDSFGYAKIDTNRLDGIQDAVRMACQQARLGLKKINASINSENVIVRYLMLPRMDNDDLKAAMEFEVERYVPFEKKDIVSDFMPLNPNPESKNMKVLLVAAKKEDLLSRVKMIKDTELEPEVMTIDSIVLRNPFQINHPDKNTKTLGLINIGAKVTNINIVRDATSFFMRDVQLGGDNVTQLLKEKLDMTIDEAEQVKFQLITEDKEKFKIIEPVLGNLLNEIYLSFDYYESEFGMPVDEIALSGGSASLTWLMDFLKENLNREITIYNPFEKIAISSQVNQEKLPQLQSSLAVACGLALENFN